MDIFSFLGRLHPVVLHLPIGALATIVIVELSLLKSAERKDQLLIFTLYLFASITALLAMITGLILHQEDAYGGATLELHKYLGIATSVATWSLTIFSYMALGHGKSKPHLWIKFRWAGLFVTLGIMTVTGHLGGELTHGKDFLTHYGPEFLQNNQKQSTLEPHPTVFNTVIQPILKNNCIACHDANKAKGKLRMDSPEAMLAGGSSGQLFMAGDPENSLLLQRMQLPLDLDDDDHMPPENKRQPKDTEIAALVWWIEQGASFDLKMDDPRVPKSLQGMINLSEAKSSSTSSKLD
jgi:uncharacterized membrane protein